MVWIREGECNRCGDCCREVSVDFMTGFKGDEPKRLFGCMFFNENPDGTTSCDILAGDISLDLLTEEQRNYFLTECDPYPNPNDEGHTPPRYTLPKRCGFRMVFK